MTPSKPVRREPLARKSRLRPVGTKGGVSHYYNEHDPKAAAWLRALIAAGHIPAGDVDERDIREVQPDDVNGYAQAHFFCGIAGWPLALRLAGWPERRRVWTGSCPCQPFSSAARGRNRGVECDRHLWPELRRLVAACCPPDLFGEQVVSARGWLDGLCDDVEALDYSVRACVLPAYCVGRDHARERIYFACHANGDREPIVPVDAEVAGVSRLGGDAADVVLPDGFPARVALGAFGNAVVPELAAEFVSALMDVERGAS